jgi:cathepsin A (carboxypeptidase C)
MTAMIEDYLNLPSSFAALSVPEEVTSFSVGSMEVSRAFELTNDR